VQGGTDPGTSARPLEAPVAHTVLLLRGVGIVCAVFGIVLTADAVLGSPYRLVGALLFLGLLLPAVGYLMLASFVARGSLQAAQGAMLLLAVHTLVGVLVLLGGWYYGGIDAVAYALFAGWLVAAGFTFHSTWRAQPHLLVRGRGFEPILPSAQVRSDDPADRIE
jgi:hypothetical protein